MLLTLEVRWFHPGMMPPEVLAWFGQDGLGPVSADTRIDQYLQLFDTDSLGIKVREGRLEIKQRQGRPGHAVLRRHVAGWAERWCKWSFALNTTHGQLAEPLLSPSAWIAVHKTRRMRRYELLADGTVRPTPAGIYPEQGCNWEITQVSVRGRDAWTVGLEAFGRREGLRRSLSYAADRIVGLGSHTVLCHECSFGYPSWLIQVMGKGRAQA